MVSIIKNQLLKHLSRFTKNLSADKINLSTFKGEGELTNLELNETVLTDLLELPSWLRLTSAWCNKVSFRIQWTKLKNVPIVFSLDEVNIIVETCEDLRPLSTQAGLSSYTAVPGKYSFINKVIDGITVTVGTVNITFNSPAFVANVQISRILVESKSPAWQKTDLRVTRIKDTEKGQLLIFKELEWQTLRIEAKSTKDKNLTPLRLLTNQAKCRITIKKRLSDSFILGSRLVVILDDLLWVLTDSQLKAALHFVDSLSGLIQKATQVTRKVKAARKLEELPEYRAQLAQQARVKDGDTAMLKMFTKLDVVETSYHFVSHQIILHLCDDPGVGRSCHPNLKDGGALQICLQKFHIDYYPYHLARGNRKHWPSYKDSNIPHVHWQEQAFNSFKTRFFDLLDKNKTQHTPLTRANKGNVHQDNASSVSPDQQKKPQSSPNYVRNAVVQQLAKIMTTCLVMRIEDFKVYRVTTSGKKSIKDFISGDRDHISLPEKANIVHAEFIYYYYPDDSPFPIPPPKFYVQINPIQIVFDVDSCLWFNSFILNLYKSLLSSKQDISASGITYVDVKIEAILPRIIFESTREYHTQKDRPKSLTFQATRATITNVRSLEQSSRADLAKCVDSFHMGSLFFGSEFPSNSEDFYIVTQKFLDHISATDNIRTLPKQLDTSSIDSLNEQLNKEFLWVEAKDVWCVNLDPVWGDFMGARAVGFDKSVPFLDAMPITLWAHANMDPNSTVKPKESGPKNADIHALAHISNLVSIQINHYQYLFLLRLAEEISELTTYFAVDSDRILQVENSGSIAIGALIPQLEITFVMPSQCPGKESSGGDVESFIPESSSIADDVLMGGSAATIWQNSSLSITQVDKRIIANGSNVVFSGMSEEYTTPIDYDKDVPVPKMMMKNTTPTLSNMVPNNLNAGISSMKEKFSNLMTSLDSALKNSPDDISDTVSVRSDVSSDSETFVVYNLTPDIQDKNTVPTLDSVFKVPEFHHEGHTVVEIASEVIEEENTVTTTSDHSLMSSCRRKDLVSVSTFKLTKVEFLQQSVGYSSSIKVQVGDISSEDCCSIPWDEFQSKFSSRSRAWTDTPTNSSTDTTVKLRMDHDITLPLTKSVTLMDFRDQVLNGMCKDFIDVHVNDLNLELLMSTVTGLADLIEDEIIPIPIPLEISISNVQLHLNEDRPAVNITSPGPVPIDLNISHMFIERGKDGVFKIMQSKTLLPKSDSVTSVNEQENLLLQQNKQLKADNEELRRRLVAFERVSEENRALRRSAEESDLLRTCLSSAQGEVAKLLEEKKKLLDEVKRLHEQLLDRHQQWNTKR